MYSYTQFKFRLNHQHGLSRRDIYYIIGVFFEFTDGFTKAYERPFYDVKQGKVIYVSWSPKDYAWNILETDCDNQ